MNLKLTFTTCVDQAGLNQWRHLLNELGKLPLYDLSDVPVWMLEPNGRYSVKSFYNIVNFRGILPVHTQHVWKLRIVPRVQIFLWLVYNNKILTRNNLAKRQHVPHMTCVFCSEAESCHHLFFDCVVSIISVISHSKYEVKRCSSQCCNRLRHSSISECVMST